MQKVMYVVVNFAKSVLLSFTSIVGMHKYDQGIYLSKWYHFGYPSLECNRGQRSWIRFAKSKKMFTYLPIYIDSLTTILLTSYWLAWGHVEIVSEMIDQFWCSKHANRGL